jgi:hypothetical protein
MLAPEQESTGSGNYLSRILFSKHIPMTSDVGDEKGKTVSGVPPVTPTRSTRIKPPIRTAAIEALLFDKKLDLL